MKKIILPILLFLTIIILPSVLAADCGGAVQCACGDKLTSSQDMWYDLQGCPNLGLKIKDNNIMLNCNGHVIEGDGFGGGSGVFVGMTAVQKSNIQVKNCKIKDFFIGIDVLYTVDRVNLENNTLINNSIGINVDDINFLNVSNNFIMTSPLSVDDAMILCHSCTNAAFFSNTFNYGNGLDVWQMKLMTSNNLTIFDNNFSNGGNATSLFEVTNSTIRNNNFDNSSFNEGYLIYLHRNSDSNSIYDNTLTNSKVGFFLDNSKFNNIYNNNFLGNNFGIYLDGYSTKNRISENLFENNNLGIDLSDSQNNLVWLNKFIGNVQSAVEANMYRTNYWNFSNIGNYWDDFESNPGFPNYYEIPGTGTEKDYSPVWNFSSAPNTPGQPIGPTNGINLETYNFTTNTTDPEGDNIYYQWDWGNGNYSGWEGPFNSGANINYDYSWENPGIYNISVRAKDVNQIESNWSDYLTINISQTDDYYFDNSDSNFFKIFGRWKNYNYVNSYNGNLRYIQNGIGVGSVGWRVSNTVPQGSYEVYVWKFEHPFQSQTATNAKYSVTDVNGTVGWFEVNQSSPGNEWILLGNYYFDNSSPQGVTLNDDADGIVIADAIKLVAV
jgi:parallel beta-helix repeat protein